MSLKLVSKNKSFSGEQRVYSHVSKELDCEMKFAVYLPESALDDESTKGINFPFPAGSSQLLTSYSISTVPVLYFLSGLTCTETNFIMKAGAQRMAAEHGLIIVCPDTSPRNVNLPGEDESWDFGSGAGFYIDATKEPWSKHYRMFSYVTKELVETVNGNFPADPKNQSIFGHSMGGHGALICSLKNPGLYKSVSAFSAICNPIECPWGKKAFTGYLGSEDTETWKEWDATELVKKYQGAPLELFLDQGDSDDFYTAGQLLPKNLVEAARSAEVPCVLKIRPGYDHSYYYIATFVEEHILYHVRFLKGSE